MIDVGEGMKASVYGLHDDVDFAELSIDGVSVFDTKAHTHLCAEQREGLLGARAGASR
eukprot:COSAG04_NODE_3949_length_2404_cov_1.760087_2_plen_58_part_00